MANVLKEITRKNKLLYPLSKTPVLKKKILMVEKIISDASKIILVKLNSDNETDVVIYKVGKFGKFVNKEIHLRPGLYTVVGSRKGYKDFRKIFKITAGKDSVSLYVQCKEKI